MMQGIVGDEGIVRSLLGQHWDVPAETVFVSDATTAFPWCRNSRIFIGSRGLGPRAFACAVHDRWFVVPMATRPRDGLSTRAASAVLSAESPLVFDTLDPTELADALRNLIAGPGAVIATRELLAGVDPTGALEADPAKLEPIDVWTRGGSREARAQFRRLCESPAMVRDGRAWTLRFGAFTSNGAFERWVVDGQERAPVSARAAEVCPPGTFRFPYG